MSLEFRKNLKIFDHGSDLVFSYNPQDDPKEVGGDDNKGGGDVPPTDGDTKNGEGKKEGDDGKKGGNE